MCGLVRGGRVKDQTRDLGLEVGRLKMTQSIGRGKQKQIGTHMHTHKQTHTNIQNGGRNS